MPFANLSIRLSASGLEDVDVLADALAWLIGDKKAIEIERSKSWHGSPIHLVTAYLHRKAAIKSALANLGPNLLKTLKMQLKQRMDERNALHFRLDKSSLASAQIAFSEVPGPDTVKVRLKFLAFPGQDVMDVAHQSIDGLIEMAKIPILQSEEE